jgi:hypothetical protein
LFSTHIFSTLVPRIPTSTESIAFYHYNKEKGMKNLLASLFVAFSGMATAQNLIQWNSEIEVADGASYGNIRPRIVLAAHNIPVVIAGNGVTKQLYAARWNGTAFSTPVAILPANMEAYLATWTGPDVAAKGDTIIVVFKAEPMHEGNVYAVRSTDGGLTFSDTIRVDDHNAGVAWMPSVEIDENGNPSVVYMAHDSIMVHPRYVVAHSTDAGLSYNPTMDIALSIPDEACDCCPAEYLINGNREVMLFRNNDNNTRDIFGVYSNDGGLTYPSVEQINQLNWVVNSCPSTGPSGLLRTADLITVSTSKASGKYRVYVTTNAATTALGSSTEFMLTPPTNVNGNQNYPRISGTEDTIVIAWQENDPSNYEVFCALTTTGTVNDFQTTKAQANTNASGSQTNPDVIYRNGVVHYVFQDSQSGSIIYKTGSVGTLGVNENEWVSVAVYPNPSSGVFHFTGKIDQVLKVVDQSGRSVPFNFQADNSFGNIQIQNTRGSFVIVAEVQGQEIHIPVQLN